MQVAYLRSSPGKCEDVTMRDGQGEQPTDVYCGQVAAERAPTSCPVDYLGQPQHFSTYFCCSPTLSSPSISGPSRPPHVQTEQISKRLEKPWAREQSVAVTRRRDGSQRVESAKWMWPISGSFSHTAHPVTHRVVTLNFTA